MKAMNISLAAAFTLAALSCTPAADTTRETEEAGLPSLTPVAGVLARNVSEAMSQVILDADSIKAAVYAEEEESPTERNVAGFCAHLLKFQLCQPTMYSSDEDVYGLFSPFVTVTFFRGGETATALFDYGLGKWMLQDSGGERILRRDLPKDALLSLFYVLFEDSQLMQMTYEDYCKGK